MVQNIEKKNSFKRCDAAYQIDQWNVLHAKMYLYFGGGGFNGQKC